MKITVIGWYGTETIGDRAILAGLLSFFTRAFGAFEIKLGSLFPFFSERTIHEDHEFWEELCRHNIKIELFNSRHSKELDRAISESDFVAMGGGPLMDMHDLYMIEYAFKRARKLGKKTALLGCGVGPLYGKSYRKSVLEIAKNSDLIILRDSLSKDYLRDIFKEFNTTFNPDFITTSFDPAVECVLAYNRYNQRHDRDYIAINLRKFPNEYARDKRDINSELFKFVKSVSERYKDREIRLIPMHYFHIGNDDREFLNLVKLTLGNDNLRVQNSNLSLKQTIEVFRNAHFNVGMRFHSVVLQTVASGKNYILDYTEPKKGKILGFIEDIDDSKFYTNRYICLQTDEINTDIIQHENDRFSVNQNFINNTLNIYNDKLRGVHF